MSRDKIIEKYLFNGNLSTYDPYDIWKTDIGLKVKRLFYKNRYLGLIPAGLLTIYDFYLNNSLRLGYKKQEYPVVRAQATLALLNLYKEEKKSIYLQYAKEHIDWLIRNSSDGYSGYCWGTGFEIVISDKLSYDSSVPFSTNTPYILEALYEYFIVTNDKVILEIIKSIYQFYEKDLIILKESDKFLITSYAPFRDRVVTNAVSYTMFAYSIFYKILDEKEYITKRIKKMYNFLVSVQDDNGSWFYAPYDRDSFIDCFHSAFVLKNIIKTRKNGIDIDTDEVLVRGYRYIKENFYDSDYRLYRRFSISNKPSIVKFDLYDNAEMLYLAKLMRDNRVIGELESSISQFIYRDSIYSVLDIFGFRKNRDTLRWAVMPYILAKSL